MYISIQIIAIAVKLPKLVIAGIKKSKNGLLKPLLIK
jgi:hypothetical protein